MSHFRCRDCNSLTTTSDNIRPSTIVDDYGNPVGCLNCGSNNVFREFNQIKEEAPEDAPTTNIVTKNIIPKNNTDTLDSILLQYKAELKHGLNELAGHDPIEQAKQALNLYIEEKVKSCIPKFSDMNVSNADQMEGFRKACLLMEANVEKRDK